METKELSLSSKEILARLAMLQEDMKYVREHIEDTTLSEEDLLSIKEAKRDLKEGKAKRL